MDKNVVCEGLYKARVNDFPLDMGLLKASVLTAVITCSIHKGVCSCVHK